MLRKTSVVALLALAACVSGTSDPVATDGNAVSTAPTGAPSVAPADSGATQLCSEHQADFDRLVETLRSQMAAQQIAGASIAVVCKGSRIFSAGLGVKKKGASDPITTSTRFQLASITKTFTATAALRLAERNVIHLDDPVREAIPGFDGQTPYSRPFTWAELLSHTSGFPTDFERGSLDLATRVAAHAHDPLWAPPGAVFNYSNEGYTIAGLGLQNASSTPIRQLIETEVFGPAGMTDATMDPDRVEREGGYAVGHAEDGSFVGPKTDYLGSTYYAPMGGAWASVDDMARFAIALMKSAGPLLQAGSLDQMTKPRAPAWPGTSYGLGLEILDHGGGAIEWTHDGGVAGFGSFLGMVPSAGFAYAILLNSETAFVDLESEEFAAFTGNPLAHPAVEPPVATDPDEEVGVYESNVLGTLTVTKVGTGLQMAIAKENRTVPLDGGRARYAYSFQASDGFPADAIFRRDATGRIAYLATEVGVGERQ